MEEEQIGGVAPRPPGATCLGPRIVDELMFVVQWRRVVVCSFVLTNAVALITLAYYIDSFSRSAVGIIMSVCLSVCLSVANAVHLWR